MNNQTTPNAQLTSTTAPGKTFSSRSELADHYKSDWHKYNLKRREMNMAMLTFEAFNARLEAALALKKEREVLDERSGKDHLKVDKKNKKSKNKSDGGTNNNGRKLSKRQIRQEEKRGGGVIRQVTPVSTPVVQKSETDDNIMMETDDQEKTEEYEEEAPPVIDPTQSLFDKQISNNVQENVEYMYNKYGFFIPDKEYLIDLEGLVGYCAEKIKLGHMCLYCQKMFTSWRGCQEHMIHTRHTKLKYEAGVDLEEFDVFYDFTADDVDFLNSGIGNYKKKLKKKGQAKEVDDEKLEAMNVDDDHIDDADDDSGEWEDIDSDEEMDESEDADDGLYAAYQDEIAKHGLDVTPLGEIVFPDGRIIGHRGLSRYYKQRITLQDSRPSVVAARRANGECLIEGRVYSTYRDDENEGGNTLALARAGFNLGSARGRQGHGILVPTNGASSGGNSFTAVSLYRYKAAVKKARKEEFKARRLEQRTTLPMNKMDKKGNRLCNNVSVAHAPR